MTRRETQQQPEEKEGQTKTPRPGGRLRKEGRRQRARCRRNAAAAGRRRMQVLARHPPLGFSSWLLRVAAAAAASGRCPPFSCILIWHSAQTSAPMNGSDVG